MNATTPQQRQPDCCAERTPSEHCIDTRKLAELLDERQYRRAVRKGLNKAARIWRIHL